MKIYEAGAPLGEARYRQRIRSYLVIALNSLRRHAHMPSRIRLPDTAQATGSL